jgi:hypothetical protein
MHDHPELSREVEAPSREDTREGRWLSYAELGQIRGIGRESAKKLSLREGWRRVPGNDGAVRVLVPDDWLKPAREASRPQEREPSRDTVAFETALAAVEAAHAGEVTALKAQLDTAEQGRLAAQALADAALAQLADTAARSDNEITTLRDAVDGMRQTLARTEDRAAIAEGRAVQAETRIADATAETETLREAIEGLRAKIGRAEDQASRADAARQEAQERLAELTRADEGRRARGRLRRAWDGWRGR